MSPATSDGERLLDQALRLASQGTDSERWRRITVLAAGLSPAQVDALDQALRDWPDASSSAVLITDLVRQDPARARASAAAEPQLPGVRPGRGRRLPVDGAEGAGELELLVRDTQGAPSAASPRRTFGESGCSRGRARTCTA
jgi:hypothetical protein